jgi:hypothetical protein
MNRDIEVAENVLSTLIKQEMNSQRNFFGMEIRGSYLPGYGVTFRLPGDYAGTYLIPMAMGNNAVIWNSKSEDGTISVTTGSSDRDEDGEDHGEDEDRTYKLRDRGRQAKQADIDSLRDSYNQKLVQASKDFIVDYGDFVSQLGPNERIIVTNQGDRAKGWYFGNAKRTHISIEGSKSDIVAFKQGKLTRAQALAKLKVLNTESVDVKEPDMELLSSIFSRLYRSDLSKTYFTDDNIYYEVLKDYGVIYYMEVYSSTQGDYRKLNMPTVGLDNLDQAARDKKVAELYPKFEQDLKENIAEYGRTLKSLKDEEILVFKVTLTKCKDCNIPSNIEVSVKSSVLKEYGAGKMDKSAAISRFTVKKGPNQ